MVSVTIGPPIESSGGGRSGTPGDGNYAEPDANENSLNARLPKSS
ncbi:MAG: hypothetical protein ABW003_30090 [Microvirga sp.]